jgi:hypothetical protein
MLPRAHRNAAGLLRVRRLRCRRRTRAPTRQEPTAISDCRTPTGLAAGVQAANKGDRLRSRSASRPAARTSDRTGRGHLVLEAALDRAPVGEAGELVGVGAALGLLQGAQGLLVQAGVGRQRVDDLLSQRRLSRIKDGARTLVSRAELEAYLRRGGDDPSAVRWGSAA